MGPERKPRKVTVRDLAESAKLQYTTELLKSITFEEVAIFEMKLHQIGLSQKLEELYIIPAVHNPNPYNAEVQHAKHQAWWETHPTESVRFEEQWQARTNTLKQLYVGMLLGSAFAYPLLPGRAKGQR
jgi:hypothetical protein